MKTKNIIFTAIIPLLSSCSPSIQLHISKAYPAMKPLEQVRVIEEKEQIPGNAENIGQVAIGNNTRRSCSYNAVLELAKVETRKIGGNAIKIIEHKLPNEGNKCHRISASILRIDSTKDSTVTLSKENNPENSGSNNVTQGKTAIPQKLYMRPMAVNWQFRLAVNGNWSWRTAKLSPNLNDFERSYMKDLKSGHAFGGEIEYYFGEKCGAGFKYNIFRSSASVLASAQVSPGVYVNGELRDEISIVFIGPKFCVRIPSETYMNAFLMGISIGYLGYTDQGGFGSTTGMLKGSTVGLVYDLGYDYGLTPHFALGANFGYTLGALSQYEVTSGGITQTVKLEKDQYEGLGHVYLGFGLRFR
jgi:hypothetical protein